MIPIVAIVGRSGSGKTTLVEGLVGELTARGLRVGTIKHDAHSFEIDKPGKDSWRHKEAGARTVVLSSPDKLAVIKDHGEEPGPAELAAEYLTDLDVAVVEGYKKTDLPKIEVVRSANSPEPVCAGDESLMAYATDVKGLTGAPSFALGDVKGLADLIEEKVIGGEFTETVTLTVDGQYVPLKPFIEDLLREAVIGMTRSLKGCKDAEEITIRVKKR